MTESNDFLWRLTMPEAGSDVHLETGDNLQSQDMDPAELIAAIGDALIQIGTRFLMSVINNAVYVSGEDELELDLDAELKKIMGDDEYE